jgi:hypothetical protein
MDEATRNKMAAPFAGMSKSEFISTARRQLGIDKRSAAGATPLQKLESRDAAFEKARAAAEQERASLKEAIADVEKRLERVERTFDQRPLLQPQSQIRAVDKAGDEFDLEKAIIASRNVINRRS